MTRAARTIAALKRDSLALLTKWQAEIEERAAPEAGRSAAEVLADLSAAIDRAVTRGAPA